MSRIPSSAIPHAWADDSEHAKEVRRARGEVEPRSNFGLKVVAAAGLAYVALRLLRGRRHYA